jgi:putative membrane protein
MILVLALLTCGYLRGWVRLRSTPGRTLDASRAVSFLFGVLTVWAALDSPLADHDRHSLTVHMIQHLLLMTIAPAVILLSEPLLAVWYGSPRSVHSLLSLVMQTRFTQGLARVLSRPALCWTVSALTLLLWHVPALLTMALQSDMWHAVQQSSFVAAGFLFWWPVVQPWPSPSTGPQWSTLLYLFLATLPCDVLAGFLVFSDRVAYRAYLSMPRHSGLSVLEDQQRAGALMWTVVTIVYFVAAGILSARLLSPQAIARVRAAQQPASTPDALEIV